MRKSIFLTVLIFLCSCSNVPKPTKYPISFQKKMQATHHWDILAADIAKEVKLTLQDRASPGQQIYLESHDKSLFSEVFTTLLKTQLFQQGIEVTESESNSLKMKYETQMVRHKNKRRAPPLFPGETLLLTALGYGVYKAFDNNGAGAVFAAAGAVEVINALDPTNPLTVPHHEIIITTEVRMKDRVIARRSNIYYINDVDNWHYGHYGKEMPPKHYRVVSE